MNTPLFSVVIPAYNREKTLERCLKSVLHQSYPNVEIIVIDDGSTDTTKSIVNNFSDRIRYYYQENSGAQRARNNGLNKSHGKYILFLDSDDWLLPNCLVKMAKTFEENDDVGAVYCLTGIEKNNSIVLARKDLLSGYVYSEVLRQGYLTSTSFISMRKEIFDKIGNWDESFPASQDDDMCFRISKHYPVVLLSEILGVYGTDAGKGKQIGSSRHRVALGWMLLWEKYRDDVIASCGTKVYIQHIKECVYRFARINDVEHTDYLMRILHDYVNFGYLVKVKISVILLRVFGRIKAFLFKE